MPAHHKGPEEERIALDAFITLFRAADSLNRRLSAGLALAALSAPQFGVLETLLHVGPLCQKDLARKHLRSGGNITMVVDNLERRGLVERVRGAKDRRFMTVHLTPAGRRLITRTFPPHARAITEIFSVLTREEQMHLAHVCKRLGMAALGRSDEARAEDDTRQDSPFP